jgi:hypothetical protein
MRPFISSGTSEMNSIHARLWVGDSELPGMEHLSAQFLYARSHHGS